MLPRFHLMSATMLALAATMAEEDSPVVPSPDDLDASPDLWSTPLGRAMVDDMRADEAAQEGSHYDKVHDYLGDDLDYLWSKGKQDDARLAAIEPPEMRLKRSVFCRDRNEQRANKKRRATRKAKKGWA